MDVQDTSGMCTPESLTPKLNYVWLNPSRPLTPEGEPFWIHPPQDLNENFIAGLAEQGWRVDFIRQQINRLKLSPKGRARVDLLRQLVEGFLNPERLARQLDALSDEEQRFYTYLLLQMDLTGLRTQPTPVEHVTPFSKSPATLMQRMIDAGLGLRDESGGFFVPSTLFSLLPPRYIQFPPAPEPATYIKAADPQLLLAQIQQLLSLVQAETYPLRSRPRWTAPRMGYSRDYQIWPPKPVDAQRLLSNPNFQGNIELCAPEPYLSVAAIAAWSSKLGLSPDNVELLFHLLINAYLLRPGSPVTVNGSMIQAWMMRSPGSQITTLFRLYRNSADWADWWPAWRSGRVKVEWNHQVYWDLNGIDRTLATTHYMMRCVILNVLSYLPHDIWLSLDKVVDFLEKLYPKPETHYYQQGLQLTDVRGHWKGFLTQALRAMLQGPLYILGFVEAAPNLESIAIFRLRHFQDVQWERVQALPIEGIPALRRDDVTFLPKSQIIRVTPPAQAEFLTALQQWSQPKGLAENKLTYQLDVRLLHSAFEKGETPETLATTWEKSATFPPFPEIQQWWQHWWERYGHIRLYPQQATLMTRDEFTLHELQVALPTVRDAILGLVTPRVALLQPEQVSRILSDLERQGYMPKEEA